MCTYACNTCISYVCFIKQVMQTEEMLYLVTEYAPNGEIFGKCSPLLTHTLNRLNNC